jgi:hypothetical protein
MGKYLLFILAGLTLIWAGWAQNPQSDNEAQERVASLAGLAKQPRYLVQCGSQDPTLQEISQGKYEGTQTFWKLDILTGRKSQFWMPTQNLDMFEFSPDLKQALIVRITGKAKKHTIHLVTIATKKQRLLYKDASNPKWYDDKQLLFLRGKICKGPNALGCWAGQLMLSDLSGNARALTKQHQVYEFQYDRRSGAIVFAAEAEKGLPAGLYFLPTRNSSASATPIPVSYPPHADSKISFSHMDGKTYIAVNTLDPLPKVKSDLARELLTTETLRIFEVRGEKLVTPPAFSLKNHMSPMQISPTRLEVLASEMSAGGILTLKQELVRLDVNGNRQILSPAQETIWERFWSPDGNYVAYVTAQGGCSAPRDLHIVDRAGRELHSLYLGPDDTWRVSSW